MKILDISNWKVDIFPDLVLAGHDCDNEPYYGEVLTIRAERPDGLRVNLKRTFQTFWKIWDEEECCYRFGPDKHQAEEAARVVAAITKAGVIRTELWTPGSPVYGSEYYQKNYVECEAALGE